MLRAKIRLEYSTLRRRLPKREHNNAIHADERRLRVRDEVVRTSLPKQESAAPAAYLRLLALPVVPSFTRHAYGHPLLLPSSRRRRLLLARHCLWLIALGPSGARKSSTTTNAARRSKRASTPPTYWSTLLTSTVSPKARVVRCRCPRRRRLALQQLRKAP
jgi:hypothetical protein